MGPPLFCASFSLESRGRNLVSVCLGTACHVRGAERLHDRIKEQPLIQDGGTTEDRRYTLESVRCIGCCNLGPVIKVNDDVHARLSPDKVERILGEYE
jgi:NADH:ubiquinone oxidoreductase subunit E